MIEERGEIYTFQALCAHRMLMAIITVAIAVFMEAARISLSAPTSFHLWILIPSAGVAQLGFAFAMGLEISCAKKKLAEMRLSAQQSAI